MFWNKTQTQKRLKRTLFIRTKHNIRIFQVIPFFKLQNNTLTTVKRWKTRCRETCLILAELFCHVVFVVFQTVCICRQFITNSPCGLQCNISAKWCDRLHCRLKYKTGLPTTQLHKNLQFILTLNQAIHTWAFQRWVYFLGGDCINSFCAGERNVLLAQNC